MGETVHNPNAQNPRSRQGHAALNAEWERMGLNKVSNQRMNEHENSSKNMKLEKLKT